MASKKTKADILADRDYAEARLREFLIPDTSDEREPHNGTQITCITTSVSETGMSRRIKCLVAIDGNVRDITHLVSDLMGWRRNHKGLLITECGMDMHAHVVYGMSRTLFGSDYKLSYSAINIL